VFSSSDTKCSICHLQYIPLVIFACCHLHALCHFTFLAIYRLLFAFHATHQVSNISRVSQATYKVYEYDHIKCNLYN
jgi:hypothetical protein